MLNFTLFRRWQLRRLLKKGDRYSKETSPDSQIKAYDTYIEALGYTKDIIYLDKNGVMTNLYYALNFTIDVPYQSSTALLNDAVRMLDLTIADVAIRKDSLVQLDKKISIPLRDFLMYSNRFSLLVFIETSMEIFRKYRDFLKDIQKNRDQYDYLEYNHRMVSRRLRVLWFVNAMILATCSKYEIVFEHEEGKQDGTE